MKNIAVFTGNRAEFGLQAPLLHELKNSENFNLTLLVAASHIDPEFGSTIKEIEESGFEVNYKIDFKHDKDNIEENPKTISVGINLVTEALKEINPDLFVVYADRYEGFAAVIASTQMGIVTAHIEGGDVTEGGTFDDSVRHAMSKLSHLHFTTNSEASLRIQQLGENPKHIFEVGLPSVDLIENKNFTNSQKIISKYELNNIDKLIVFTQHSVPINNSDIKSEFIEIENALKKLTTDKFKIICTYPNSDIGGKEIIETLKNWDNSYEFIDLYESLGREDFHGLLDLNNSSKIQVCYLGNSSAGIKETPALKCPSVILGDRQKGRLSSSNIIYSNIETQNIVESLNVAFNGKEFLKEVKNCKNPYGSGNMAKKTVEILSELSLNQSFLKKKFFDIKLVD
ncbi:UDP-N-acetylglucosamine 2-epimerase [Acidimicrobiaceae bacterium]|nr:UDP-N-acetylglucosamine 2-epimerase [Acidimicrobiaceae bacterium]